MLSIHQLEASAEKQPTSLVISAIVACALVTARVLMSLVTRKMKEYTCQYAQQASTLPVLSNTLDVMVFHNHRIYDWFADECVAANGRPWLLTKTHFDKFQKEEGAEYFTDLFGKNILASDDDVWYFHRKTASNLFSNQMMKDMMYKVVREKAKTLCDVLKVHEARGDQGAVSFKSVITHFTSDVFGKIGFGVDLHCLENGVNGTKGNEFVDAFATSTRVMYFRFFQPVWLWQLKRFLNISIEKTNTESREVINKFIFRIINESIEKRNSSAGTDEAKEAPPPKDHISLFLNSKVKSAAEDQNLKGKAYDSEMHLIRDTVVNFIFAGKDTTSNGMSFFIVMMNRYPRVLEKLQDEL